MFCFCIEEIAKGTSGVDINAMSIKPEREDLGESSFIDEPDVDDFDDSSLQYPCDGDDDQDESSDVDFM